jgi:hypothetical protein
MLMHVSVRHSEFLCVQYDMRDATCDVTHHADTVKYPN